ncbi:lipoprotein NlpI [Neiella marina]|uniref:Lipoprotein NlpI n=1 Tax=Neiella holothuriorum TaxID=2870530 RepID=A0ABS7EF78_9GAMM|nr:lipoprotein NlpI [Neiella holothuriorum]MBW8190978.1 lipoprotein NlpI [Neiella holothuriorum]
MSYMKWMMLLLVVALSGCANSQRPPTQAHEMLLAVPRQPNIEQQAAIAKLTEIISLSDAEDAKLAHLFYDRGVRYDSLGLKALAHLDFSRALRMKADFADAYNFVGIHYTQGEQFVEAFEAFGSAIELNPDHKYALLNRGIARYYAGRNSLAAEDFGDFLHRQESDPYRVLWLYLAEYQIAPESAKQHLQANRTKLRDEDWATQLVDLYLNRLTVTEFLQQVPEGIKSEAAYAERLCEAYFYLGKLAAQTDELIYAGNFFRLALATNVYDFVEHRYAMLELKRLNQIQQASVNKKASTAS